MKALCNNEQVTIRLAEIDAPEKRQAFNQESKQSLSDLCFNKKAKITAQTQDRYRRTIAHVNCDGFFVTNQWQKRPAVTFIIPTVDPMNRVKYSILLATLKLDLADNLD